MKSVYIHIPFCNSICSYCDFCKMIYNPKWVSEYLISLKNEINQYYEGEEIKTIYIGGGSPSSLSLPELEELFQILNIFNKNEFCEFSFELNINDITKDLLLFLKNKGVNRLSIGIQSFDNEVLKFLKRNYTKKDIIEKLELVKKLEFDNISFDLIYAVPEESLLTLKNDINYLLKFNPNHISTYSLIFEPNTEITIKNLTHISEEEDAKMYEYIVKKLTKSGYIHYEVSNFSLPGYESIHNTNYWNNKEYFGFGLGSHGYINGVRYQNTRNLQKYMEGNYRLDSFFVSKREEMENQIMLGLRKIEGINIEEFFNRFKVNIQDEFNIIPVLKQNLLVLNDKMLKIPEDKIYVMNEIINKIFT